MIYGRDARGRFLPRYEFLDPRTWGDLPLCCPLYLDDHADVSALLDYDDWAWAIQWRWRAKSGTSNVYACRTVARDGTRFLHKEILYRQGPPPSPKHTIGDHMNGNSLDDRRSNLRWATPSENGRNRHGFYVKQGRLAV